MSSPTPPTYKTKNWPAYNEALKRRGSLTIAPLLGGQFFLIFRAQALACRLAL